VARVEGILQVLKESILAKGLNVFDCLEYYELEDVYDGTRREQQMKCPGFHGEDRRKSARIYENGTMFCWACDAAYDIFAFEMKYAGISFTDAIYNLAKRYDIEYSNEAQEGEAPRAVQEIKALFQSFETQKPKKKFEDYFKQFSAQLVAKRGNCTLEQYQGYWYLVDQLAWKVSLNELAPEKAIVYLDNIYREASSRRV